MNEARPLQNGQALRPAAWGRHAAAPCAERVVAPVDGRHRVCVPPPALPALVRGAPPPLCLIPPFAFVEIEPVTVMLLG